MGPQTKATIWNSIFTLALLIVTGCYAYFTLEMTNITTSQFELTRKQFEISYRPYIYFDKFELQPEKFEGLEYVIVVKNSGLVPAKVKIEKYCINDEDNCNQIDNFTYIFPGSDGSNIGAIGSSTEFKKSIQNGDIKLFIKLKYWSISDKEMLIPYIFEEIIRVFKDPSNPLNFLHENIMINAN